MVSSASVLSPTTTKGAVIAGAILAVGGGAVAGATVHPAVGFAVVAGVAAGIGILVQPLFGLAAFILTVTLLPFAVIPVPIGGVRLTFTDAILLGLLFVWLARLLSRRIERIRTSPLDAPVLVFIGLAIASYVFGIQSTSAEVTRLFFKAINGILFFLTVSNLVVVRRSLRLATLCLVVGAFGASLIAVAFYFVDQTTVVRILSALRAVGYYPEGSSIVRTIAETTTVRAIGTSVDPNVLAGTLLLTVPYTATQLFSPNPVLRRSYLMVGLGAMLLCLVLTFSRSSWVGAVAACLILATLRYRRIWLIVGLVGLLIAFLPTGDLVIERFQSGVAFQDRAAQMRLGEYKDALRLIAAYPWFGVGFGAAPDIELYIAASSVYLLIAEEMGLIGLTAFALIFVVYFTVVIGAWRRTADREVEAVLLGSLGALTAALTAGAFDHYFFNLYFPQTVSLFWLNVGLGIAAARLAQSRANGESDESDTDQQSMADAQAL